MKSQKAEVRRQKAEHLTPALSPERKGRTENVTHGDALPEGVLLFTKPQMAAAMQVSIRCLTGMMRRGEISFLKIHGRLVRFHPAEALRRLSETSLVCRDGGAKEAGHE